jgi:hypothetical protein
MLTTPIDAAAFQAQVDQLAKVAATSTDECVVATLIAVQNKQVQERVVEKAKHYVWKGQFCDKRADGKIAVVFNFECHPGQICLVKPWFAAVVDLEFGTVYGIQDPYQPETLRRGSSVCRCAPMIARKPIAYSALLGDGLCDTEAGREFTSELKDKLAAGNERSGDCIYIYINGTRFQSKHHLRSRHKVRGVVVYDAQYDVIVDEDLTQPNPQDIKVCADTPVGKLCVTLADIIAIFG